MKKIKFIFVLLLWHNFVNGQLPQPEKISDKLTIKFSKNVELLGFAYFLVFEGVGIESKKIKVGEKEIPKKDWHKYGFQFYQQYKTFAENPHLTKALTVAHHLWLDYIINFLLQVDDFPQAKLNDNIAPKYYLSFSQQDNPVEAKENAEIFLDGLNKFFVEVDFDKHLQNATLYYEKVLQEVKSTLPNADFIIFMEDFYRKKFEHYNLVPSLTIPNGMGFGPRYAVNDKVLVFSVFGAYDFQKIDDLKNLEMGFANENKLRELSVHEFGHSFVNPEVYQLAQQTLDSTAYLLDPIRTEMEAQGYNTWKVCLIEHLVRAGEIMIALKMKNKISTQKLEKEYIKQRKFIYLPDILPKLMSFDKNKNQTYQELIHSIIISLQTRYKRK
jgi:hypothetical protein